MTHDERDDANDSQALTCVQSTCGMHQLLVTRSTRSQVRINASLLRGGKPSVSDMERVNRIGRYLVEKPRAEFLFHLQQSGELKAYSDADWRGDRTLGDQCRLE